jgi:hypothetical protein
MSDLSDFIGVINLWQLTRLPKAFDFKYSLVRNEDHKYFNSIDAAIKFASVN